MERLRICQQSNDNEPSRQRTEMTWEDAIGEFGIIWTIKCRHEEPG
jgi:hypothetical protein